MVNKLIKTCLTSLVIEEMQLKTTANYDFPSPRTAGIALCWRGREERGPPVPRGGDVT